MTKTTKNIVGIVITVLIIIVMLMYSSYGKNRYFNKVVLSSENRVFNITTQNYMDTVILVGLSELRIKGVDVLIKPLVPLPKGPDDLEINAFIRKYGRAKYVIEIGSFSKSEVIGILSHELMHLHQYHTSRLHMTTTSLIWYDRVYITDIPHYFDRPWEIEAEGLGRILEKKIRNQLYN